MTKALEKAHQVKAIMELYQHDHAFLSEKGVEKFTKPFGFKGTTYVANANPESFKGLSLYDDKGNPITKARGQDADVTACEIARHLGVEVMTMHGRGSQLRVACTAILDFLNKKAPSPENA